MIHYENLKGVPNFECEEFIPRKTKYCLCIPIINEGERVIQELRRAKEHGIDRLCDIIICDGNSDDGSTDNTRLVSLGVNSLLIKKDTGKQGAQLRMGFWWALRRGYNGIITIDGNNKDSIEDTCKFIDTLDNGYDFIQGSRFIKGGQAINTPFIRYTAVRLIHAPIISLAARHWFTDTTNAFRGYSRRYLEDDRVQPLRDIFTEYELLAYLSVRATQIGLKACEVPVRRSYPRKGNVPTKISPFTGNFDLLKSLVKTFKGEYTP